jgi:hypothetical protein
VKRARGEGKAGVDGREEGLRRTAVKGGGEPDWAQELLEHLRPTGRDVRRVVAWLGDTVQGTACLQDDSGALLAGTRVAVDEGLAEDIVRGRIASASWEAQGQHLRLVKVEGSLPSTVGVLAVSRPPPFDRRAS